MTESKITRRGFLAAGAVVGVTGVSGCAVAARDYQGGSEASAPGGPDIPHPDTASSYEFLTPPEAAFVDAATERLVPQDDLGPGANKCGVTLFIDHQLAGSYGRAASWYMQGPWAKGTATQGFQSRLAPAALYRASIGAIDRHVASKGGADTFAALGPQDQEALLSQLEAGTLDLGGPDGKAFFKMLLQNTKEGMFSDPIYGGNRDMAGWKMLGFPGARYDYSDWVGRHGQRYDQPPVGLAGRPAWNVQS